VEESNKSTIRSLLVVGGSLAGIGAFALLWIMLGVSLDWFGCGENRDCWSYEGTCPYCFVVRCIPAVLGLGLGLGGFLGPAATRDPLGYIDSGCENSAEREPQARDGGEGGGLNAAAMVAISIGATLVVLLVPFCVFVYRRDFRAPVAVVERQKPQQEVEMAGGPTSGSGMRLGIA
jgi:hypothetical protein